MPLYEYQCKKCGHRFEKIQSFSAEPLKECPVCQGEVERLISAPAVQFKGSGFYSTDYGARASSSKTGEGSGDSSSKPASANGDAGAASPAKSESKSDKTSSSASTDKSS
jgi:putative FmdB family regulatory protein